MTYQCQDADCKAICSDTGQPRPLVLNVPARSYKAGQYGLTEDKSFPAYSTIKCPWCRGKLIEIPEPT